MNLSKRSQKKYKKRTKTQAQVQVTGHSAFDESIALILLNKIKKSLCQISKSKYEGLSQSLKLLSKDLNVMTEFYKDRANIQSLITHLLIFSMINKQQYQKALQTISREQKQFDLKTHGIIKLSMHLLKALVLKFSQREQQCRTVISLSISQIDIKKHKKQRTSVHQNMVELSIMCIAKTARHFSQFQNEAIESKQIYQKAYKIANKYLTQYHKITETLYYICQKFSKKNKLNNQRNSNSKYWNSQSESFAQSSGQKIDKGSLKVQLIVHQGFNHKSDDQYILKARLSQVLTSANTNKYQIKSLKSNSKKQNSFIIDNQKGIELTKQNKINYLNVNSKPLQVETYCSTIDNNLQINCQTKTKIRKRLKTLEPTLILFSQKQQLLNKLYGNQKNRSKIRSKIFSMNQSNQSISFKSSQYPQQAAQMKQLQTISKIYLPRITQKNRYPKSHQRQEKLNAIQALKFGTNLQKLKPHYFHRIMTQHREGRQSVGQNKNNANKLQKAEKIQIKQSKTNFQQQQIQVSLQQKKITVQQSRRQQPAEINFQEPQQTCQLI